MKEADGAGDSRDAGGNAALPALLFPKPNQLCTLGLSVFLKRHRAVFDLFMFGISLATGADHVRLVAAKALASIDQEHREKYEKMEANKNEIFSRLTSFSALQSENLCIRLVDNFLCYLSETVQLCMRARPEMLRSGEQVKIEDVLRFASVEELVEFLVERKVNELSYGGVREMEAFMRERTGIEITRGVDERALLTVAVELRNLYTHNRGIVNHLFLKRVKGNSANFVFERGKRFHADFEEIVTLANNMFAIAVNLDGNTAPKFALRRKRYKTWVSDPNGAKKKSKQPPN